MDHSCLVIDSSVFLFCSVVSFCSVLIQRKGIVQFTLHKETRNSHCMFALQTSYLQCPVCKAIYGVKQGNQPPGIMNFQVLPFTLPGYEGCGTIQITYHIPSGVQGPEHPRPGMPYTARGFPRHGYLPNNDQGRRVRCITCTHGCLQPGPNFTPLCMQHMLLSWRFVCPNCQPSKPTRNRKLHTHNSSHHCEIQWCVIMIA